MAYNLELKIAFSNVILREILWLFLTPLNKRRTGLSFSKIRNSISICLVWYLLYHILLSFYSKTTCMVQILTYVLRISDIITKPYKLMDKQLTEKEFLKSLGPVITNSIDWGRLSGSKSKQETTFERFTKSRWRYCNAGESVQ